jgi:HEAT repeat protein
MISGSGHCYQRLLTVPLFAPAVLLTVVLALATAYFHWPRSTNEPRRLARQPHKLAISGDGLQPAGASSRAAGESASPEELMVLSSLTRLRGATAKRSIVALSTDLLDVSRPLIERQRIAWKLGKLGSEEAVAILRQGLHEGPAALRITIAEALGNSESSLAHSLLRELLKDKDRAVARAAIRRIAALGDADSVQLLAQIALDSRGLEDVRIESALALGKVTSAAASDALIKVLGETSNEVFLEAIISGLGEQSFVETEGTFRALLDNANTTTELRVAALEALGYAKGDPTILLMEQFDDPDPAVRAAAAWALANLENLGDLTPRLLSLHAREADPEVRARILQALEHHSEVDP